MRVISVGEFKSKFSQVLDWIRKGEEVVVSYGRKKEEVAVLIDINKRKKLPKRKLGTLQGKGGYKIHDDFKMTTKQLLNL